MAWAFLAPIPLVGPVVALAAWVGVLKGRYPVGWIRAAAVGVAACIVAVAALRLVGIDAVSVVGVPGA